MDELSALWAWVRVHPIFTTLLLIGAYFNVAPRPHPEELKGWKRWFWSGIDLLCFLTARAVPGRFKWFFTLSPRPPAQTADGGADKKGDGQ